MDAFIHKYRGFLLSSLYLLTALLLLGYATVLNPIEIARQDANILNGILKKNEIDPLSKKKELAEKTQKSPEVGIRSLPTFLRHINNTARRTGVIIRELTPGREGDLKFVMKVTTDYLTFLKLAAKLEALNLTINDLQVRPFKVTATPPEHAIEFSLTPRGDAAPLESGRVSILDEQVRSQDKRNPFQRFAYNAKTRTVSRDVDLTWIHNMTSIGMSAGRRVATIDGKDRYEGDELESGHKIRTIDSELVRLERKTDDGLETFVLRFRKSKFDGTGK